LNARIKAHFKHIIALNKYNANFVPVMPETYYPLNAREAEVTEYKEFQKFRILEKSKIFA
jgi:hypothetical protein